MRASHIDDEAVQDVIQLKARRIRSEAHDVDVSLVWVLGSLLKDSEVGTVSSLIALHHESQVNVTKRAQAVSFGSSDSGHFANASTACVLLVPVSSCVHT